MMGAMDGCQLINAVQGAFMKDVGGSLSLSLVFMLKILLPSSVIGSSTTLCWRHPAPCSQSGLPVALNPPG